MNHSRGTSHKQSPDRHQSYVSDDLSMLNNSLSKEDKAKLLQKKKDNEEAIDLKYLFEKYSSENVKNTLHELNALPYDQIITKLE